MAGDLAKEAQELLKGMSAMEARTQLLQKGFLEEEVDSVLNDFTKKNQSVEEKKMNRHLALKETFDRIAFGFATPQFINILFMQSGAGLLLIGLANGGKTLLSLILSSLLHEYTKRHTINRSRIYIAGLVYGFSFFLLAFATLAELPWLFVLGFLLGAVGVVTYGDLYHQLIQALIKHERKTHFLRKAAFYGIMISGVSLLVSGYVIDFFQGQPLSISGFTFQLHGFLISFMVTAFAIIISSHVLSGLADHREKKHYPFFLFLREHYFRVMNQMALFVKNPYIALLLVAGSITGILQVLGTSYYGIFIYQEFKNDYFGGFTNIAVLYGIALIFGLLGPSITRFVHRSSGLAPSLVFGTILSAILPFILVYNSHYFAVLAALVLGVIGGVISGSAQGLIAQKIMREQTRKAFFAAQVFMIAIPYLIFIPIGAYVAQNFGLELLFTAVGIGLMVLVAPLYFILVALTSKTRL